MKASVFFFLGLLLANIIFLLGVKAVETDYLSAQDAKNLEDFLLSKQNQQTGLFGSLKETNYAISTLRNLDLPVAKSTEVCNEMRRILKQGEQEDQDLNNLYHVLMIAKQLDCANNNQLVYPRSVIRKIESSLFDEENKSQGSASSSLIQVFYGVHALFSLPQAEQKNVEKLSLIIRRVHSLLKQAGSPFSKDSRASLVNSAVGLSSLSQIVQHLPKQKFSSQDLELLGSIVDQLPSLFNLLKELPSSSSSSSVAFFELRNSPSLQATSFILSSIDRLYALFPEKFNLQSSVFSKVGGFLVSRKESRQIEDLFFVSMGLKTLCTTETLFTPIAISLKQSSLPLLQISQQQQQQENTLKLKVTDLLGKPVSLPPRLTLLRAFPQNLPSSPLTSLSQPQHISSNKYQLDFLSSKPAPNYYTLELSAMFEGNSRYIDQTSQKTLKVDTPVSIEEFEAVDLNEEGHKGLTKHLFSSKRKENINLEALQGLFFSLKLKDQSTSKPFTNAQQVSISFTHSETREQTVLPFNSQKDRYSLTFSPKEQSTNFVSSGEYEMTLFVADSFISKPISFVMGSISLHFDSLETKKPNKVLQTASEKLSEKFHTFRQPDSRPPQQLSTAFTAVVLSPLLILFIGLIAVGANLRNFPSGLGFFSAVLFQVFLAAILVLFYYFWLELTMLTTLKYLFLLSVPTTFFGLKNLRNLRNQ